MVSEFEKLSADDQTKNMASISDEGMEQMLDYVYDHYDNFKLLLKCGDSDTSVVFTDVDTSEQYVVGYITHGVTEKIKLKKGSWYKVEGKGKITLYPVKVRIE